MAHPFFTIGHSTRPVSEFVELLKSAQVEVIADVRKMTRSRTNPQYNGDVLSQALARFAIGYEHIPPLGGLRARAKNVSPSLNAFWENQSFHNYADYALSRSFSVWPRPVARIGTGATLRRRVRRGRMVAMPSPHHCGLFAGSGEARIPHSRRGPHRAGACERCSSFARRRLASLCRAE
jgi:hypothetical protein